MLLAVPADFQPIFECLRQVLSAQAKQLAVSVDTEVNYTLVTKSPSPFPQHKGNPLFFGSVNLGKAYVSFHLVPIYMNPNLAKAIPPNLKKRMQGKACFNFKTIPDPELLTELKTLIKACLKQWSSQKWL